MILAIMTFLGIVLGTSRVQSGTPTCFDFPGDMQAEHPDDRGVLTRSSASASRRVVSGLPSGDRSMTDAKRRSRPRGSAGLAGKMADAVMYLSRVADGAGMDTISADLLSIRERLAQEAQVSAYVAVGHRKKRTSRENK